jgi:hypothetical protein
MDVETSGRGKSLDISGGTEEIREKSYVEQTGFVSSNESPKYKQYCHVTECDYRGDLDP